MKVKRVTGGIKSWEKKFVTLIEILLLVFLFTDRAYATIVSSSVKRCVAFFFIQGANEKLVPQGTGFFVGVPSASDKTRSHLYFITARHVLRTNDGKWVSNLRLRINTTNGGSVSVPVPIRVGENNPTTFVLGDPTIDLAAMPVGLDENKVNFTFIINVKYKMPMNEVKLSTKNQIVVPREARETLGVKAGDRLLVVVRGETVVLLPKPKRYAKTIAGIGKDFYPKDYLSTERDSWQ